MTSSFRTLIHFLAILAAILICSSSNSFNFCSASSRSLLAFEKPSTLLFAPDIVSSSPLLKPTLPAANHQNNKQTQPPSKSMLMTFPRTVQEPILTPTAVQQQHTAANFTPSFFPFPGLPPLPKLPPFPFIPTLPFAPGFDTSDGSISPPNPTNP